MPSFWRVAKPGMTGTVHVRKVMGKLPFAMLWISHDVVISSTGNKTYTMKVLGKTCTFTTNFPTTGSYTIAVGVILRNIDRKLSVIVFPPTYITKSAGTTVTNGILPSTVSLTTTDVDLGAYGKPMNLHSPPMTFEIPSFINQYGYIPLSSSSESCVDPFVGTAITRAAWTADEALTTDPIPVLDWYTDVNHKSPHVYATVEFGNLSGSTSANGLNNVALWGDGVAMSKSATSYLGPNAKAKVFLVKPGSTPWANIVENSYSNG